MNRKAMRAAALQAAQNIIDNAKAQGRANLTEAERQQAQANLAEVDRLDAEIVREGKDGDMMAKLYGSLPPQNLQGSNTGDAPAPALDLSNAKATLTTALATKSAARVYMPRKAFSTAPLGLPAFTEPNAQGTPEPGAVVSLAMLFPQREVDAPAVSYYVVDRVTGFDVVAEGALKPELTTTAVRKDAALQKLAGRFKVSTEFQQDADFILAQIQRQAMLALVARENALALAAMDAASGVLVKTGLRADALDVIADGVGEQQALNGYGPDVLVANPTDLGSLRKLKSGGSGEYVLDPYANPTAGPFGVQVLATPGLTAGTMWLLRREAGTWYHHESGVQLQLGTSGDDFDRNMQSVVIEERVLPVINQPGLITKITLT